VRGIVKDVQPNKLILKDGEEVPYGLLVWSTGVGPSFVKSLPFPKSPGGRYNRLVDPKIMYLFGFFAIFLYVYMFPPFEKLCPYTSM
jgi:NADH dehydrogenase FAD-containing subunit